jgi:hypothetical protein
MSRTDPQLTVRFPGDLKQRLADAATRNSRSINAEIVQRLEESFRHVAGTNSPPDEQGTKKLIIEMHELLTQALRPATVSGPWARKAKAKTKSD